MGKTWLQCPAASASQPAPQYFIAGNLDGPAKPNYSCLSGSKPVRSVACLLACLLAGWLACYRCGGRPACLPRGRVGAGTDPFSAEGKPSCTATRLRIEEVAYATTLFISLLAHSFRRLVFLLPELFLRYGP